MPLAVFALAMLIGQDFDLPATDDQSAAFSRKYLAFIKQDARKAAAARRLPTTFFFGKAKLLLTFPQTPWEQAHLGVCRQMLELLDSPSGKILKQIQDANPKREIYEVKQEDRLNFDERFSRLMGFEDPEATDLELWTSSAGYSLGELAGELVTWHYHDKSPEGRAKLHAALDRVAERAKSAPPGVDPHLITQMTAIGSLPRSEQYRLEQLRLVGMRINACLSTILPSPGSK